MKCNENVDDLKSLVCDYVKKQKVNLIELQKVSMEKVCSFKAIDNVWFI